MKKVVLGSETIGRVDARIRELLAIARAHLRADLPMPTVLYQKHGRTAGMAYLRTYTIDLNPVLLLENEEHFIHHAVGHELAHLVAHRQFGPRIRPHGREWQAIMQLFGLPAERCHHYDTTNSQMRRQKRFVYKCACKIHELSAIRHNRSLRGTAYKCLRCHHELTWTGQAA